jgi:hypothetical protein
MKENCAECKHHDVFWGGSGCNLLNNGERCKFEPKVMTNADRIRAMSDAALADFLEGEYGNMMPGTALNWLKQPAKG